MTQLDIINNALVRLGVDPILSLEDQTPAAKFVNIVWDFDRQYCLSLHPWNFATKTSELPSLTVENDFYKFLVPPDLLEVVSVRNINNNFIEYKEEGGYFYSKSESFVVKYVFNITNVNLFPIYFSNVLAIRLACSLSLGVLKSIEKHSSFIKMFEYELDRGKKLDSIRGRKSFKYNSNWIE